MKYEVIARDGRAKRARMETVHGTIETPVFMNVGTVGAIKGAVSTDDLRQIGTQVELSNTYHLHVRTGDELIKKFGGLHKFMNWDRPILTDSGGFQVFSLTSLRKIKEEGVYFNSHIDGRKIFMGPEESMQIQSNLGSTIAMAFDECPPSHGSGELYPGLRGADYPLASALQEQDGGIKQPSRYHQQGAAALWHQPGGRGGRDPHLARQGDCPDGPARLCRRRPGGGRDPRGDVSHPGRDGAPSSGKYKPVYLMGVGTPANILEAVDRGVDFFDCVYPSRNGRHGHVYTNQGKLNLFNQKYELDPRPIEEGCGCPACRSYSRAYIRHLLKAKEMLGMRLCTLHNLYFYNTMMKEIRDAIEEHRYAEYKQAKLSGMAGSQS